MKNKIFETMRAIAIFEGVKGAMVLLAGFGALAFLHRDLQVIADHIVRHLHLDPASRRVIHRGRGDARRQRVQQVLHRVGAVVGAQKHVRLIGCQSESSFVRY